MCESGAWVFPEGTGDDPVTNRLRAPGGGPYQVIPSNSVGTFSLENVELTVDSTWYGTVQAPRLYLDGRNADDLSDPDVQWPGMFWSEFHATPAQLTILTPP